MINLKEAKNNLSQEKLLSIMKELGAEDFQETSEALIFSTICHNVHPEDGSHKLYYYKKNKMFHCYTQCSCSFDIYELIKRRYEMLNIQYDFFKDIVLKVADKNSFGMEDSLVETYESDYDKYKRKEPVVDLQEIKASILNIFIEFYTPEWEQNGISIEAMKTFNILYSVPQNKIIIPHYDKDNRLIGIRGRALNPEDIKVGKYMPIQIADKIYNHPLGYNLYGLNLNKENIRKKKMGIIFEAEKSVLQYETMFGRENNIAVAVCGSNITNYQFQLLRQAGAERILIAFDKEGQTWKEKEKHHEKIKKLCKRNSNNCLMGYLYDKPNLLNLKDSPTDRGKEIFQRLYREGAVWIK